MQNKDRCLRERFKACKSREDKQSLSASSSAQGGLNAAILVAIIAGLIILYIVFLPTSEREKLVQETSSSSTGGAANSNVLLSVSPGALSTNAGIENEKSIPNIFLVETTNAKELKKINPFIVKNGLFDKETKKIDFDIDDPDNTDNAVVSFTTTKRQGILTIKLNNAVIFENELQSDNIEPVRLDKRLLGKTNTLEFSVSSVGLKFWTTNAYNFENVKIIGDITDTSKQESTNVFSLSEQEFKSMGKATLKFTPYCGSVNDIGPLDIFVNNKKIFSSIPVCNNAYSQNVPQSVLNNGENNIVFKTNKGSYSVEQIKIALDFKEPQIKTYYFEIDSSTFNKIRDGSKNVLLTIKFVDDKKHKRANLDVNNHIDTIDTDGLAFSKNINSKVSEGNNFVILQPFEDMEVADLRIELTQ